VDKFVELAVSAHADLIVSGDPDLLALNPFHGISIVTSETFDQGVARSRTIRLCPPDRKTS
jgi:predicted nucleic acid-binding protein